MKTPDIDYQDVSSSASNSLPPSPNKNIRGEHLLSSQAVHLQASYLTPLCLSCGFCQMGIVRQLLMQF